MTLYEINKQAHAKLPDMTQEGFRAAARNVWEALDKNTSYFMLLCKEQSDYTVFRVNDIEEDYSKMWNEILDIFDNRGYKVKDIYPREDKNIEYWVQDKKTGDCFMYLLFVYDWGVIEL